MWFHPILFQALQKDRYVNKYWERRKIQLLGTVQNVLKNDMKENSLFNIDKDMPSTDQKNQQITRLYLK